MGEIKCKEMTLDERKSVVHRLTEQFGANEAFEKIIFYKTVIDGVCDGGDLYDTNCD